MPGSPDPRQLIQNYLNAHGVKPEPRWLASTARITEVEAIALLAGFSPSNTTEAPKRIFATRKIKASVKPKEEIKGLHIPMPVVRWVFFIIGCACAILSCVMAYTAMTTIYHFSLLISGFIAFILAGLSASVPQAFLVSLLEIIRTKSLAKLPIAVITLAVSITTSIVSTNIVASNIYITRIDAGVTQESVQPQIDGQQALINLVNTSIATDQTERLQLVVDQKQFKPGDIQYERIRNNLYDNQQRINENTQTVLKATAETARLKGTVNQNNGIVHGGTESIINYGLAGILEFSGPICMSLALFL
jgi:hypothetical protein